MWYVPIILAHGSLKQDIVTASRPVWENIKAFLKKIKEGGGRRKNKRRRGSHLQHTYTLILVAILDECIVPHNVWRTAPPVPTWSHLLFGSYRVSSVCSAVASVCWLVHLQL